MQFNFTGLGKLNNVNFNNLTKSISKLKHLKYLDLSCNQLGNLEDSCIIELFKNLKKLKNLEVIDLGLNDININNPVHLKSLQLFFQKNLSLRKINLENNNIWSKNHFSISLLFKSLSTCINLNSFKLELSSWIETKPNTRILFVKHFKQLYNLEKLSLFTSDIDKLSDENFVYLCDTLKKLPQLVNVFSSTFQLILNNRTKLISEIINENIKNRLVYDYYATFKLIQKYNNRLSCNTSNNLVDLNIIHKICNLPDELKFYICNFITNKKGFSQNSSLYLLKYNELENQFQYSLSYYNARIKQSERHAYLNLKSQITNCNNSLEAKLVKSAFTRDNCRSKQ